MCSNIHALVTALTSKAISYASLIELVFLLKISFFFQNGVINGMLIGINKFLQSHHQGPEAVIINLASTAGITLSQSFPVYSATKAAVIGISRAMAKIYKKSRVRVVTVCPGLTDTNMAVDIFSKKQPGKFYEPDHPDYDAQEYVYYNIS